MKPKSQMETVKTWLREELFRYLAILTKLEEQRKAVDGDDEARLLAVIQEKSSLMAGIEKLERKIAGARKNFSAEEQKDAARHTGPLTAQIEDVLKKIIAREDACAEEIKKKQLKIQERMLQVKQGKTGLKGYGDRGKNKSWFSNNA
ncbi:MAG: hypothetical protein HZA02_02130 [Nitrospinae bacterium]|nr:hypothetical protein [Nitrospinota bacterium]